MSVPDKIYQSINGVWISLKYKIVDSDDIMLRTTCPVGYDLLDINCEMPVIPVGLLYCSPFLCACRRLHVSLDCFIKQFGICLL